MPQAKIEHEPWPFETFASLVGGHKWVVAPRTSRLLAQYGEDVVFLTLRQYKEAERVAWLLQTEGLD